VLGVDECVAAWTPLLVLGDVLEVLLLFVVVLFVVVLFVTELFVTLLLVTLLFVTLLLVTLVFELVLLLVFVFDDDCAEVQTPFTIVWPDGHVVGWTLVDELVHDELL
jgi:hypothetical protein